MDISNTSTTTMAIKLKHEPAGQGDVGESIKGHSKLHRKHGKKSGSLDKSNVYCNHCKNITHTKDKCWKLHPKLLPKRVREKDKSMCRAVAMLMGEGEWLE